MSSQEKHIITQIKGRYYTYGDFSEDTKCVWFAIHGYGQLAKFFIRKFESLNPEDHFVIAPEGLNRFYLSGFEGRVGATWMTRENRLVDIENYIAYLDNLYQKYENQIKSVPCINVLGFSQGAATVSRWITTGRIKFHHLILWAGIFPPDLKPQNASGILKDKSSFVVIGNQDEYITAERIAEMERITSSLGIKPKIIHYEGGHTILPEVLDHLATSYLL